MKIEIEKHNFHKKKLPLLSAVEKLTLDYESQGLQITLRQLYYRLFAEGFITENDKKQYQKLGELVKNAKLAGILDMEFLEDRTRRIRGHTHFLDFTDLFQTALEIYKIDLWEDQEYRVMVFSEKDALIDIIQRACFELDCACFSCRGFPSISSLWEIARRLDPYKEKDILTKILYLGDHDCSGVVIDQNIQEQLDKFGTYVHVERIALTYEQIIENQIPGTPAKTKELDKNYKNYIKNYGDTIWELDGLPPDFIYNLVIENIEKYLDIKKYNIQIDKQEAERRILESMFNSLL